ncbi:His/Glu/Gln/Arg/opine family amino acid ABC transporter permease subunit [Loktanella ponticola]|uniref:His/Glu/Gln/Arg/opine family amino acid ABC transporter permease subunit n=1 Tax=Yoonia ponticola TaxID=1524255 RepID=A0A7W9BHR5_9RHOB|nr:amino acid ABC transporter permease [Yoonia ponticola]MBB5720482.1 His/Glu/Gln/Arg/opine family amino acid ABC transporter permease subunit [Yoonia ponticola]
MIPTSPDDKDFPWWLLIVVATGVYLFWQVFTVEIYERVLTTLTKGIWVTVYVTVVAYLSACLIGLGLATAQMSRFIVLRQAARLYVEVVRGIPIIVLLLYVAFVAAPGFVSGWNWVAETLGFEPIRTRDFSLLWRAVIALTIAYSSFLAEVFRAGLQSVDTGQIEAAEALGLNKWQRFRHIVFPQAFRTILPPLGNDFVAMVKDSSLVSVLGVTDVTQLGKVLAAGNFRYFETYNVVALVYLTMTITLSLGIRRLEKYMRQRPEVRSDY